MVLSESNAGGTAWGLTDLNRGVGIFVGLHNVLNSLVLSHGDLTHQVRLLHLLSGVLGRRPFLTVWQNAAFFQVSLRRRALVLCRGGNRTIGLVLRLRVAQEPNP